MSDKFLSTDLLEHTDPHAGEVLCVNCGVFSTKKSTWKCAKCRKPICESNCDFGITIGCAHYNEFVCSKCFGDFYQGKKVYCNDTSCHCYNAPPKRKAKKAYRAHFEQLPAVEFDKDEWKSKHKPISYASRYYGRYLVDIATSSNSFEKGYIDWLINQGSKNNNAYTEEENAVFQIYVEEAKELKKLLRPRAYNFRKRK